MKTKTNILLVAFIMLVTFQNQIDAAQNIHPLYELMMASDSEKKVESCLAKVYLCNQKMSNVQDSVDAFTVQLVLKKIQAKKSNCIEKVEQLEDAIDAIHSILFFSKKKITQENEKLICDSQPLAEETQQQDDYSFCGTVFEVLSEYEKRYKNSIVYLDITQHIIEFIVANQE